LFDKTTQDALFNEYITPGVTAEIVSRSKLWANIRKSWKQIEPHGRYARQKLLMASTEATGARSDASYPTAQESTPGEAKVYIKRAQMFSLKWDGLALEASSKGGTPISAMEFEKKGLFIRMADDLSRQLMLDGSGRVAQANGAGVATATLTLDSPWYAGTTTARGPSRFLKADRVIDVYLASASEVDSIAITSVDSATQVTLASVQTWTDDAWVFNEDAFTATEGMGTGEMMGLMGICDDADPPLPNATAGLQGLLVASYPEWIANVFGNSGTDRELSEDLMIQVMDECEDYSQIDVILTSPGVRRKYFALMKDYVTLPNQKVMWGGFSGLKFDYDGREIPVVMEKFVPDGKMLFLDSSQLTIHTLNPNIITWEKGDAGGILQKVANYNQYVAEGHIFANLGTGHRRGFGLLEDITEPS
jgi:hypothetical protein